MVLRFELKVTDKWLLYKVKMILLIKGYSYCLIVHYTQVFQPITIYSGAYLCPIAHSVFSA